MDALITTMVDRNNVKDTNTTTGANNIKKGLANSMDWHDESLFDKVNFKP